MFADVSCFDVQSLVVGKRGRQFEIAVDVGDVELGVAVGEELQQFFLAGTVEFGGDVVDEDDGRGAAVGGD